MADLRGESSNHLSDLTDDIFAELERWEAILSELPDFYVDESVEDYDPPDLSPS